MIVTSRYDFTLPELNQKLYRQPLSGLRGADWQKKCDRLVSFRTESEVESDLQQQAKAIADGNPRLLEWLDKVLQDRQLDQSKILEQIAARAAQFRESILVVAVVLIKRRNPHDRRGTLIALTTKGCEVIERATATRIANDSRLIPSLSMPEKQLVELLRKVLVGFETEFTADKK